MRSTRTLDRARVVDHSIAANVNYRTARADAHFAAKESSDSSVQWLRHMPRWRLFFVPVTIGLEFLSPQSHTLIFAASCLAILPLAGWLGDATEQLAHHTGQGSGDRLNATFGNAAELIIAIMAMREGLYSVVKASLTGSIIGNILLVLGAAALAGGLKHKHQKFNRTGACAQSTLLTLAAIGMIAPAAFHYLAG